MSLNPGYPSPKSQRWLRYQDLLVLLVLLIVIFILVVIIIRFWQIFLIIQLSQEGVGAATVQEVWNNQADMKMFNFS